MKCHSSLEPESYHPFKNGIAGSVPAFAEAPARTKLYAGGATRRQARNEQMTFDTASFIGITTQSKNFPRIENSIWIKDFFNTAH
ncbi:MAG: hypothetical protein JNL53_10620 [Cyclobacteriaceae bacterium]|nr:hypothetical protein [Cyclobacteriaceae bacterium]